MGIEQFVLWFLREKNVFLVLEGWFFIAEPLYSVLCSPYREVAHDADAFLLLIERVTHADRQRQGTGSRPRRSALGRRSQSRLELHPGKRCKTLSSESFNGRLRDKLPNETLFRSLRNLRAD